MISSSALFIALVLSSGANSDSRWLPWLGCWSLMEDEVRQPFLDPGVPSEEPSSDEEPQKGLLCISPDGSGGAEMRTFSGDEAFLEESLVADGKRHDIEKGGCRGWQKLDWSKDGRRLFTTSELTCEEGPKRSVSGVSMLTNLDTWIEIQSVGTGEARAVMVRRYRPVNEEMSLLRLPELTAELLREGVSARAAAGLPPLSIEDVAEASSFLDPAALEAVLLERQDRFALDKKSLLRLADASVPPRIIDLMVALSFPERFQVERQPVEGEGGGYFGEPGFYDPGFYDPFFYSLRYPYYAAPFGYYYWYAPWNPIYVVPPIESSGATVGRVIEGRGYTRITRTAPSEGGRRAKKRGDGSYSSGSDSGSSSSSGTASPEGYSRGGSEGRTAKPKKK
jgi:hypothetical protein